jgi:hypothetical protein
MKKVVSIVSIALMLAASMPARADFTYTDKAVVTGGAMSGMMKALGAFDKKASDAMKPVMTTKYVKGNRMRTDNADGTIQIIDLDARRMIQINPQTKTYSTMTFEQLKAAVESMRQQLQQDPRYKNASFNATFKPTVQVTPGSGTQVIMGQTAQEVKIRVDTEFQANSAATGSSENGSPAAPAPSNSAQPQQVSATMSMAVDMWVAPGVTSYQEFSEFYRRMAKDVNWTPPSNIKVDPRMAQSMSGLQSNASAVKGFPLVQYMSMMMSVPQGADTTVQNPQSANPPANAPSSSETMPTSPSAAFAKGFGGLFGKHKNQDQPTSATNSNPPPPSSNPGSLMDLTIEVTSFSNATLDSSLFEIPAGYTEVQPDTSHMLGMQPPH